MDLPAQPAGNVNPGHGERHLSQHTSMPGCQMGPCVGLRWAADKRNLQVILHAVHGGLPPNAGSAIHSGPESLTCFEESGGIETTLSLNEVGLGHHAQVVEARNAFLRHAITGSEAEFGGDAPNGSRDRCRENAM